MLKGILHLERKKVRYMLQNLFRQRGIWRNIAQRLAPYYTANAPRAKNSRKQIICMYDGRMHHCGISDRLRGAVSAYYIARQMGYDFRIFFVHPFRLEDYLMPNEVDWRITKEELCYNLEDAAPMFCGCNPTFAEHFFEKLWLRKCFAEAKKQVHVYTIAHLLPHSKKYGECFRQLFQPTERLEKALQQYGESLRGGYITVSLRFIGLLDDFTERSARHIPKVEQEPLMARCVQQISKIHDCHPDKKVLLTSDSTRFLRYAASLLPFVCYVPGDVVHIDFQSTTSDDVNMKLFLDMYLISRADEAYLLQTGKMYKSGFPRRAAQISGIPCHYIRF